MKKVPSFNLKQVLNIPIKIVSIDAVETSLTLENDMKINLVQYYFYIYEDIELICDSFDEDLNILIKAKMSLDYCLQNNILNAKKVFHEMKYDEQKIEKYKQDINKSHWNILIENYAIQMIRLIKKHKRIIKDDFIQKYSNQFIDISHCIQVMNYVLAGKVRHCTVIREGKELVYCF
jgi:hypothetical protein